MKIVKSLFLSLIAISVMVVSSCERYDIASLPDIPGVFPVPADTVVTPSDTLMTPVDTIVDPVIPVDTVVTPVTPVDTIVNPVTPVDTIVDPVTPVDTVVTPVDPLLYKTYWMSLVAKSPDLGPWSTWTGSDITGQYITVDPAQYFIKTTKFNLWGGPYPTKEELRQDRFRVSANFDEYRKIHRYGHSQEDAVTNRKDCELYLWMTSINFGPNGLAIVSNYMIILLDNEFTLDGHRKIAYGGVKSFGTYRHTEEGTVVIDIEFVPSDEFVKIEDPEKQKVPGCSDYLQLRRITDEDIEDVNKYSVIPYLEKTSLVLRMEGEGEKLYFDTNIMTDFNSHETVPYTIEYEFFMEITEPYMRYSEIDQYLLPDDM